ncbi:MAG: nucleotidyltransferase family protein [Eubacterium sp.]|nr:nucleotidyltransferase family protein [Eubacterium sp.]
MINTGNKEIDYLLLLLDSSLNNKPVPKPEGVDMNGLFNLADSQQVYNIILPALENAGLLDEEQKEAWKNYKLTNLKKTLVVDNERKEICRELDEYKINYMFLKGLVTREYYPQTSMRQMSDNDILYDETRRSDLVRIMKKRGYYIGASGGISDDFYKKPYSTFEFHRTLFNEKEDFCPDFDVWKRAERYDSSSTRFIMSREDHYLYTLGHMYKHYHCIEGCGIRFICDLYLIRKKETDLDYEYINKMLEEFGISDFNELTIGLSEAVFEGKELSEGEQDLLNFLFEGGVYGKSDTDIQREIEEKGGRFKFLIFRIFPPLGLMKAEYRTLRKAPFLLPVFYIYRIFDKFKNNRKYMKRDLEALRNNK